MNDEREVVVVVVGSVNWWTNWWMMREIPVEVVGIVNWWMMREKL